MNSNTDQIIQSILSSISYIQRYVDCFYDDETIIKELHKADELLGDVSDGMEEYFKDKE